MLTAISGAEKGSGYWRDSVSPHRRSEIIGYVDSPTTHSNTITRPRRTASSPSTRPATSPSMASPIHSRRSKSRCTRASRGSSARTAHITSTLTGHRRRLDLRPLEPDRHNRNDAVVRAGYKQHAEVHNTPPRGRGMAVRLSTRRKIIKRDGSTYVTRNASCSEPELATVALCIYCLQYAQFRPYAAGTAGQ